jgi:hypothetical protein
MLVNLELKNIKEQDTFIAEQVVNYYRIRKLQVAK